MERNWTMTKGVLAWLGLTMMAVAATAQTTVTTSGGTTNTVPVFTGSATVGNSPISVSGSNVGIGTTVPPKNVLTLGNSASPAWNGGYKVLDMLGYGYIYGSPNGTGWSGTGYGQTGWGNNQYFTGTQSIAVGNGGASYILQGSGQIDFEVAPSVSVGSASTFTDAMHIANNGKVGIGAGLTFPDGSTQTTAYTAQDAGVDSALSFSNGTLQVAGNIQIGNLSPNCNSPTGAFYYGGVSNILMDCGSNIYLLSGATINQSAQAVATTLNPVGLYVQNDGFHFMADTGKTVGSAYTPSERFTIQSATGNVGIGTTNPGAKLEINGGLRFTADPSGAVQTTAWTGTLCGGDYAESVDVTGNRTNYEPGDVLVLDADNPGKMLKSIEAYSTSVSGIYSTKPGTVGRRQTTEKSADEVPMAVVGIVPAKVSAENGPIKVGDLLVTSSTPGYAMKGTDRGRMLGAVVGKAMAKLSSGTGVIEVLVTLQ
jgi:hypothetical protein